MNRGSAISVAGPGERGENEVIKQHLLKEAREVYEKQKDANCVSAAITNAVDGRIVARALREYFYEENPHLLRILEATLLL